MNTKELLLLMLSHFTFDTKKFLRTLTVYLLLSIVWSVATILTNEFTRLDKGFITGTGFLLILPASIVLGQQIRSVISFLFLAAMTTLTFLFGSFFAGFFIGALFNSLFMFELSNAIIVGCMMTWSVNRVTPMHYRTRTALAIIILFWPAYGLLEFFGEKWYLDFGIPYRVTMFIFFSTMILLPLAIGINLRPTQASVDNLPT